MFQLKNYTKQLSCALYFYLIYLDCCCCSITKSSLMGPHELQHNRLPYYSLSSRVCSNSCPLCQWRHLTISFSVIPFSSCSQFFPASGSFPELGLCITWPKYWNFSISPSNEYSELIPLGLTDLISLQSKGYSRVFSNTTVWKHQFFTDQPFLWSNSHIHTRLLEKP